MSSARGAGGTGEDAASEAQVDALLTTVRVRVPACRAHASALVVLTPTLTLAPPPPPSSGTRAMKERLRSE